MPDAAILSRALSRLRLWHILAAFLLLGAWVSVVVPLGEGPDELPHFTVTRYIIQHARLPDTAAEHESFQPPLYYLLSASLTFWIDTSDFVVKADADYDPFAADAPKTLLLHTRAEWFPWQGWALAWHLMRLLSLAMGAVTIAAIGATVAAATGDARLGLCAAALTAFLPGFIFMAALVSNDNLAAMLAALLCWRIALLLRPAAANTEVARPAAPLRRRSSDGQSLDMRSAATETAATAAGARPAARLRVAGSEDQSLDMRSALLLGVLLGLALLAKTSMLAFIPTLGLALLLAKVRLGWTWRAWLRVNALAFGTALLLSGWYFARNFLLYGDWLAWPLVLAANEVRLLPLSVRDWLHVAGQAYRSFWLEWIGIALDPAVQLVLAVTSLLALLGLVRSLLRLARPRPQRSNAAAGMRSGPGRDEQAAAPRQNAPVAGLLRSQSGEGAEGEARATWPGAERADDADLMRPGEGATGEADLMRSGDEQSLPRITGGDGEARTMRLRAGAARFTWASVGQTMLGVLGGGDTALVFVFALLVLIIGGSWLRWTQTVAGTGQARLFYPALPVIILALAWGLRAVQPRLPVVVAGTLLLLAVAAPLRYLAPAYAPAPRVAALPAAAQPISATFKDKMRLIGWELPAARVHPGQTLYVALYWEALRDLTDDDWLKLQLLDAHDQFVAFKDGSPSAGRDSTDSWRAGERIASWHRLAVPATAVPGVYRLTVGIHPYGRKNWFPIAEENMWIALSDQLVLSEVQVD